MGEYNNELEVLQEYAKSSGRTIKCSRKAYDSSRPSRYKKYKSEVAMPFDETRKSYFACEYDSFGKMGGESMFSGAFIPVNESQQLKLSIRKKHIFDKLAGLFGKKTIKSGNRDFDSKVIIEMGEEGTLPKFINNIKFQQLVMEAFDLRLIAKVSLNSVRADFIPELKDHSQLSINDKQSWFLKKEEIDGLFRIIEKMRACLN